MPANLVNSVKKVVLSNGLCVLYEQNRFAPVVSLNIGVNIGSAWETREEAGLCHLLEHMVFKGSESYRPGEISAIVEGCGGELNAYTSFDHTVYYINLDSRHLDTGLRLIKEMACRASIDEQELEKEKEVVVEEIRRGKDNPNSQLSETLFAQCFQVHPYGRPIIGSERSVREHSPQHIRNFYSKWYVPNNMILAVCGDFEEASLLSLIDREFGGLKSGTIERPQLPIEPEQKSPRLKVLCDDVQAHYIQMGYPIPHFTHPDTPALDLLSRLLGEGETSLLYQRLKEELSLVTTIHSGAFTPRFPGLFIIGMMTPFQFSTKIQGALDKVMEQVRNEVFAENALERAKLGIRSSLYYDKETCEGSARKWLMYESTAQDYRFEDTYLERINQVTDRDILSVAQKYLRPSCENSAILTKTKYRHTFKSSPNKGVYNLRGKVKKIRAQERIELWKLPNGIKVITHTHQRIPLLNIKHSTIGGTRFESKHTGGIANLMVNLLEKGTKNYSSLRLAEICEEIAGNLSTYSGRNSWGVAMSCLSEKRHRALEVFCDVLKNPLFSREEFNKEKRLQLEDIKHQQDSPTQLAFQQFQRLLFTKHPYGRPVLGDRETVNRISLPQLKGFYQKSLDPSETVIAVVGDFDPAEALDCLSFELGNLSKPSARPSAPDREPALKQLRSGRINKPKMQAHIVLGFLGTTIRNPDRYAFEVLNGILSGQGGRLFLELRDKHSLAYTVSSMLVQGIEPGYFAFYIGTEASKEKTAIQAILREIDRLLNEPVSTEELNRSKNYLVGNYVLDLQKNHAMASTLCLNELFGLSIDEYKHYSDRILAVSPEDVIRVVRKYLNTERYALSVVGPND